MVLSNNHEPFEKYCGVVSPAAPPQDNIAFAEMGVGDLVGGVVQAVNDSHEYGWGLALSMLPIL